jgi:hypothetical protein
MLSRPTYFMRTHFAGIGSENIALHSMFSSNIRKGEGIWMIRCNLSVMMGKKKMNIADVHRATG